jgi:Kef-type K+ transport system membrane component KefB
MRIRFLSVFFGVLLALAAARSVYAAGEGQGDPVAPVLLALVVISVAAAFGGRGMRKLGQPAVLGELLIGVIVGNVGYFALQQPTITVLREGASVQAAIDSALTQDIGLADAVRQQMPDSEHTRLLAGILESPRGPQIVTTFQFIDLLSRVAVIVLLFLVGLETSVGEMRRVGTTATLVAFVGVVVPFLLGVAAVKVLTPEAPIEKDIFIGAILTATSVGITARVFRDLNQAHRIEAKIILGAAVIDDVLGLIILAVVSGLVVTGSISAGGLFMITLKAVVFLAGSIGIGVWITPRIVRQLARSELESTKLLFGLGLAFGFSWLASLFGLATIVGAFAAGLVLEELFLKEMKGRSLHELLSPIESLVVPVFFVLMGLQVKLETFTDWKVVLTAALLTFVAILGKVVAGWACSKKLDRLSVGIGMMPRGEVGLIFASIGKGLGVVSDSIFSAVVIMVMVTTLLTPPLLKVTLARSDRRAASAAGAE